MSFDPAVSGSPLSIKASEWNDVRAAAAARAQESLGGAGRAPQGAGLPGGQVLAYNLAGVDLEVGQVTRVDGSALSFREQAHLEVPVVRLRKPIGSSTEVLAYAAEPIANRKYGRVVVQGPAWTWIAADSSGGIVASAISQDVTGLRYGVGQVLVLFRESQVHPVSGLRRAVVLAGASVEPPRPTPSSTG